MLNILNLNVKCTYNYLLMIFNENTTINFKNNNNHFHFKNAEEQKRHYN